MGATLFTLSGMIIVAIGAFITAQSVIITELQANELSGAYYDKNQSLRAALLKQSFSARRGLIAIVIGTVLQIVGTALPFFP